MARRRGLHCAHGPFRPAGGAACAGRKVRSAWPAGVARQLTGRTELRATGSKDRCCHLRTMGLHFGVGGGSSHLRTMGLHFGARPQIKDLAPCVRRVCCARLTCLPSQVFWPRAVVAGVYVSAPNRPRSGFHTAPRTGQNGTWETHQHAQSGWLGWSMPTRLSLLPILRCIEHPN